MSSVALVSQYAIVCRNCWKVRVNVVRMCELLNTASSISCPFERNGCRTPEKTHCNMYPHSEPHARPQKQVESVSGKKKCICGSCAPQNSEPSSDCSIQAVCGPIFLVSCQDWHRPSEKSSQWNLRISWQLLRLETRLPGDLGGIMWYVYVHVSFTIHSWSFCIIHFF